MRQNIYTGTVLGLINIVMVMIAYISYIALFISSSYALTILLFNIAFVCYMSYKNNLKVINFWRIFVSTFLIFAISGLLATSFNIFLFKYIDTSIVDSLIQLSIEKIENKMILSGASEDAIAEVSVQIDKTIQDKFEFKSMIVGFLLSNTANLVISGLIGFVIVTLNKRSVEISNKY